MTDDFSPGDPPARYTVDTDVRLTITVRNPDAMERVTGPNGDEWRSQFYALHTVEDVLEHWAYNVILNGVRDVSRLDGWADLDITAVDFGDIEHAELVTAVAR